MKADVIVVGAGTAGAQAAYQLARRGVDVLCLERGELSGAGARWVNGVPAWMFDEASLERPAGPELRGAGHAFHLVAGFGPERVSVTDHELMDVDMRLLVERLQELARDAGARLLSATRVIGFDAGRLLTSRGEARARYYVDASGLAGARLLDQPRLGSEDVCVAAQAVHRVRDERAASEFFASHGVSLGDTLCFTSVAGGYSIINARLDAEGVSLLTGSIPALGVPSGRALLADFVRQHAWIGEQLFGGARAVPLGRSFDHIVSDDVALVGDAALQVFSAHGSGIGAGMVAASMLADVVASGRPLHDYAVAWQRRFGGSFAAYDVFRRFSQTLTPSDVSTLVRSGLMSPSTARPALHQRMPNGKPQELLAGLSAALRQPRLAGRVAAIVPRILAALALYRRYPERPDRVFAWARRTSRLLADRAALPAPRRRPPARADV